VEIEEAAVIKKLIGGEAFAISSEDFRDGLEVELEHGLAFADANVTNNHPIPLAATQRRYFCISDFRTRESSV
jgi:hypothetical protein